MPEAYLEVRLNALRNTQNQDGGWGYFPGKQSWLEPTVYAALALAGEPAAARGWTLVKSWQRSDGSFRPSAEVQLSSWGTSLFVTLAASRGELGEPVERAVGWLLGVSGVESRWVNRFAARMGWLDAERDLSLQGWPWKPDTSSWVEPTAHAIVALKKVHGKTQAPVTERLRMGQAQLLDVRCRDAGWNYGSRAALKVDLPSYPETTGLALIGLQGQAGLEKSLELGSRWLSDAISPLGRAWLTLALRVHGARVQDPAPAQTMPPDLQVIALEALGAPGGNHRFFKTEVAA